MGSYLIRLKILPTGPEVDSDKLLESVRGKLDPQTSLRGSKVEPIAFGLYSLTVDIVAPEGEGIIDAVEQKVSSAPMVAQYEMVGVSRLSSTLHKA